MLPGPALVAGPAGDVLDDDEVAPDDLDSADDEVLGADDESSAVPFVLAQPASERLAATTAALAIKRRRFMKASVTRYGPAAAHRTAATPTPRSVRGVALPAHLAA